MRRKKRQIRLKKSIIALLKILLLAMVVLTSFSLFDFLFTIRNVSCNFDSQSCPTAVNAELERLLGRKIIFIDRASLESKISNSSPDYISAHLDAKIPGKVLLSLAKAKELVQIQISSKSGSFTVSDSFSVTNYNQESQLGKITVFTPDHQPPQIGSIIQDDSVIKSINLAKSLAENYISIQSITLLSSNSALGKFRSNPNTIFNLENSFDRQIRALQLITSNLNDDTPIGVIDLRFSRPILQPHTQPALPASPSSQPTNPQ